MQTVEPENAGLYSASTKTADADSTTSLDNYGSTVSTASTLPLGRSSRTKFTPKTNMSMSKRPFSRPSRRGSILANRRTPLPSVLDKPIKVEEEPLTDPVSMERSSATEKSLENSLMDAGYTPLSKVSVSSGRSSKAEYIKSVNSMGHISYVKLDEEGEISSTHEEDRLMVKSANGSKVPYDTVTDLYDCLDMSVCGVAFECEGDICTVVREKGELEPTSVLLTTAEKTASTNMMEHSSPVAFPVVNASEVVSSPDMVDMAVAEATSVIRFKSNEQLMSEMEQLSQEIMDFNADFARLEMLYNDRMSQLRGSIVYLNKLRQSYKDVPPRNNSEVEKYHLTMYNLAKRNRMVEELLGISSKIREHKTIIAQVGDDMTKAADYISNTFKGINIVHDNGVSVPEETEKLSV